MSPVKAMPSMFARATTTRAEVARIAEANVEQMTMQLDKWGTKLEALAAKVFAPGAHVRAGYHVHGNNVEGEIHEHPSAP
jgi:hypothetical protein